MPDSADDLLKLVKDAVTIIEIYKGDLVSVMYHSTDSDGSYIALDGAKVARGWLERAERLLGGKPTTLLDKSLGTVPLAKERRSDNIALDEQTRDLLDLYARSDDEVRQHIVSTVAMALGQNTRFRRRIKVLQSDRPRHNSALANTSAAEG